MAAAYTDALSALQPPPLGPGHWVLAGMLQAVLAGISQELLPRGFGSAVLVWMRVCEYQMAGAPLGSEGVWSAQVSGMWDWGVGLAAAVCTVVCVGRASEIASSLCMWLWWWDVRRRNLFAWIRAVVPSRLLTSLQPKACQ